VHAVERAAGRFIATGSKGRWGWLPGKKECMGDGTVSRQHHNITSCTVSKRKIYRMLVMNQISLILLNLQKKYYQQQVLLNPGRQWRSMTSNKEGTSSRYF